MPGPLLYGIAAITDRLRAGHVRPLQGRQGLIMEIERKYLLDQLPENLTSYPCKKIEQGYLSTEPVVRIRRSDDEYYLTYKSKRADGA